MTLTPTELRGIILGLLILVVFLTATLFATRGLIKAGQSPAPSMLVVSLSLLSLTALIGGLVFDSDSSLALAGAGIGALAGAVSSVFTSGRRHDCPDHESVEEVAVQ